MPQFAAAAKFSVAQTVPPEEFVALADPLLAALEESPGLDPGRARVVLVGAGATAERRLRQLRALRDRFDALQ